MNAQTSFIFFYPGEETADTLKYTPQEANLQQRQ